MHSLRTTLILGTTIGAATVLFIVGVLLYVVVRADLVAQFDYSLIDKARFLASTVEEESGKIDPQFDEFDIREFKTGNRPGYLQLWHADGSVIFRSPSLGEGNLERFAKPIESPLYRWMKLPDSRNGRAVGILFRPMMEQRDGSKKSQSNRTRGITLVLARDTKAISDALVRLTILLFVVGIIAIGILSGVLWWIIQRSLLPLGQLAKQISRLEEYDLYTRISIDHTPLEIKPVINRLNDLLDHLKAAFERERSFSADVAHELRTPLAGLRSTLDVVLSRSRKSEEYREALLNSQQITIQMHAMVEKLLTLARLDAEEVEIKPEPVIVNDLLRNLFETMQNSAEVRLLRIKWALAEEFTILTDPSLIKLVIHNILKNAVEYTEKGGTVKIETFIRDNNIEILVSNSGSMLSQDQAEHVFDQFWRGDASRSTTGIHSGLGLSIVKKVVDLLNGIIEAKSSAGNEFQISISIPNKQTRC